MGSPEKNNPRSSGIWFIFSVFHLVSVTRKKQSQILRHLVYLQCVPFGLCHQKKTIPDPPAFGLSSVCSIWSLSPEKNNPRSSGIWFIFSVFHLVSVTRK